MSNINLTQTAAPAYLPVTLAEFKSHAAIDTDDDDALLGTYLHSATSLAEHAMGRSIMAQQWQLIVPAFKERLPLFWPKVRTIASIVYIDSNGAPQTLATDQYEIIGDVLYPAYEVAWPTTRMVGNAVTITYNTGYATGTEAHQQAAVPSAIKSFVFLAAAELYKSRETSTVADSRNDKINQFASALLARHKVL